MASKAFFDALRHGCVFNRCCCQAVIPKHLPLRQGDKCTCTAVGLMGQCILLQKLIQGRNAAIKSLCIVLRFKWLGLTKNQCEPYGAVIQQICWVWRKAVSNRATRERVRPVPCSALTFVWW